MAPDGYCRIKIFPGLIQRTTPAHGEVVKPCSIFYIARLSCPSSDGGSFKMGGSGEEKRLKFLAMIDIKGIVCPALHVLPSGHKKAAGLAGSTCSD